MRVKGSLLQFIVDNGSHTNLISVEFMKQLGLKAISHPHSYTIGWLHQGRDICVSEQCRLPYSIKPFTDEVLCDFSPLKVYDVFLGKPYLWKQHDIYEYRPHFVIITLANKLYMILEVAPSTTISLITAKQWLLYTAAIDGQGYGGVQGYFFLTRRGTSSLSVKHSIDLTPGASLPNRLIYRHSVLESDEIKRNIQELLQKRHIRPSSSPCGSPIILVQKKDGTWSLCIDYRALNKITVQNRYPILQIDDLLDQLKGGKYFRKIDLKLGYHQDPIKRSNVWKTSFNSKEGLFEWLVMPFRFTNAPTTFMRLMDDIF
eukprot:PITA_17802